MNPAAAQSGSGNAQAAVPQPGPEVGTSAGSWAGAAPGPAAGRLAGRVAALETLFREIAATRMAGVPMLHPGLAVEAVGFEVLADPAPADGGAGERTATGVLVTPWFMNLVRLPLDPLLVAAPPVGASRTHAVGALHRFDFIAAFEPGFGGFEACSLFSPMFEFEDQVAARATAAAVMAELKKPPPPPPTPAPVQASRRALLFGRGAAAGAGAAR